jgi:indolepyruvate ferredoxin oxidoreductase
MTTHTPPSPLARRYLDTDEPVFMTGVQALVRLPLDQHRLDARRGLRTATMISGYPGSPLGGFDLELDRQSSLLADSDVVHRKAVNEELAATAIWGSQLVGTLPDPRFDGVVGLWYGKAPGLDRSCDAIRHANLSGVTRTGGALALVGDDPTAKSSTVPSASEPILASLSMPILIPGDVQEVLDLGLHGVALSRSAGLWVGLKMATNVADGFGTVQVADERSEPVMVGIELDGRPYEHQPTMRLIGDTLLALEHSLVYGRLEAARAYARANQLNRIVQRTTDDRLGIIAAGKTYYDLRQALSDLGLDSDDLGRLGIRLLHVRMPHPLDGEIVREFAHGLDEIVVVEEKQPFLEGLVKQELFNVVQRPVVVGKRDQEGMPLVPQDGELGSDPIARVIGARLLRLGDVPSVRERLERLERNRPAAPLPTARMPYYCSGCPHNTSTTHLPQGALVSAGIGCHGMATIMREEEVGAITGLTQMGGEGAQWIGMAPFTGSRHIFQNIGDGTFQHSGSLAIRASIAAGTNITYKLLWNSHISMTGGQLPASKLALDNVAAWLLTEGVKRVIITTEDRSRWQGRELPPGVEVWDRDRIVEAQELLSSIEGTTVLIHDQECAAELRRARKRGRVDEPPMRVLINERVCEGCGDCGEKSNCLSVHPVDTEFGRKTQIHQASCNKDYSCLKGDCPSFLTIIPAAEEHREQRLATPISAEALPDPVGQGIPNGDFGLRITGVGGTGVVTVAQTLATAAMLDGLFVRGLDQTGLAQKGGPVVSDLKLSRSPIEGANKISGTGCDLYLAADLLTGAAPAQLIVSDPERTVSVVSTTRVPTGRMIVDTTASYPNPAGLLERILSRSQRERSVALDASALTAQLFGGELATNMLLVGAAYQSGALPLSAESVERAIEINGAAVDVNIQAFRRGRQVVCDPEGLKAEAQSLAPPQRPGRLPSPQERQLAALVQAEPGSALERSVATRVSELIAYQDAAYAARYVRDVERARAVEAARTPGHTELAEAVAFSLHKLMAYKDEYEVARLHLDPELKSEIEAQFGRGAKVSWQLHPPMLRAMGMKDKVALGPWFEHGFRGLQRMRRLRGTRLDPFGYTHVRKVERELIEEYRGLVDQLLAKLREENHGAAVEIARLPDLIRGYEEIKLANVQRYRERVASLLPTLDQIPIATGTAALG